MCRLLSSTYCSEKDYRVSHTQHTSEASSSRPEPASSTRLVRSEPTTGSDPQVGARSVTPIQMSFDGKRRAFMVTTTTRAKDVRGGQAWSREVSVTRKFLDDRVFFHLHCNARLSKHTHVQHGVNLCSPSFQPKTVYDFCTVNQKYFEKGPSHARLCSKSQVFWLVPQPRITRVFLKPRHASTMKQVCMAALAEITLEEHEVCSWVQTLCQARSHANPSDLTHSEQVKSKTFPVVRL